MRRRNKPSTPGGEAGTNLTPEQKLDSRLKAMFAAIEREPASSLLPDLEGLPRSGGREVRN